MMDYDSQLKLQAYLDGELAPAETRQIEELLANNHDTAALFGELSSVKTALARFDQSLKLPETREFYWSKIARQIAREQEPARQTQALPWWAGLRRVVVPAGAVAALLVAALVAIMPSSPTGGSQGPELEASFADPGTFTYRDFSAGTTLVWLSYPAENDSSQEDSAGIER